MQRSFARNCLCVGLMTVAALSSSAQEVPAARQDDVSSVDAIITVSYAALSHSPGRPADLQRFQSLFRPGAQLINLNGLGGKPAIKAGTIEQITQMLLSTQHPERGHFEKELARRTEQYGNVAHVWSTYQSRDAEDGHSTQVRGINSISLVNDGQRWWIVSAQWMNETKARPIPQQYLKGKR
ncbi:MAG: nuclear transport factor 2 family protein [Chlamydiota bacterium]